MNKKLTKQIRNEWKSNLWLCIELLIVSVVLWYIIDYIWVKTAIYTEPLGFNAESVYKIHIGSVDTNSPDYIENVSWEESKEWHRTMDERIRHYDPVLYSARGVHANPYSGSNRGIFLEYDTLKTSQFTILREVSPDFMQVYQVSGNADESPRQLSESLRKGEVLISKNIFEYQGLKDASFMKGKEVFLQGDTTRSWRVGAVYDYFKYSDFNIWMNNSIFTPYSDDMCGNADIHVRVKPGREKEFEKMIKEDADRLFRVGNLYIADVQPISRFKKMYNQEEVNNLRNMFVVMAFLMLNIFLGLLGTFWFRTQMRTRDIALRKVCGATSSDIFHRLIGEGMILLTIVTPLAIGIDFLLAHFEINQWYQGSCLYAPRILICACIAFILMSLMIIAGITFPARKVMKVEPAVALREE